MPPAFDHIDFLGNPHPDFLGSRRLVPGREGGGTKDSSRKREAAKGARQLLTQGEGEESLGV